MDSAVKKFLEDTRVFKADLDIGVEALTAMNRDPRLAHMIRAVAATNQLTLPHLSAHYRYAIALNLHYFEAGTGGGT